MLEKKADHLARGVRAMGVGVGPRWAAARPGVSSSMNDPHLEHRSTARIEVAGSAVGAPTWHMPALGHRPQRSRSNRLRLLNDVMAVARMHGHVFVAMKDNGRDKPVVPVESGRTM